MIHSLVGVCPHRWDTAGVDAVSSTNGEDGMSRLLPLAAASVAGALLFATAALADDWTAVQLRGQVLQLVDTQWQPLARGAVVPDSRIIRTLGFGHVTFTRGQETLDLGPNTQIQIHDRGTATRPSTTVTQYFGSVSVEAQVENVKHFAVETPYLAAVVKGTRFTVTSGKTGASVSVQRGHVEVGDYHNGSHVLIAVGQSATVDTAKGDDDLAVSGSGDLPAVIGRDGKPVTTGAKGKASDQSAKGKSGGENSANSNSGGNGNEGSGNGKGNSGSANGNGGPNGRQSGNGKGG